MPNGKIRREIYRIADNGKRSYAGYAEFSSSGEYLGSRGGYMKNGQRARSYEGSLEATKNGGSYLQNTIRTAGARGAARNPYMRG